MKWDMIFLEIQGVCRIDRTEEIPISFCLSVASIVPEPILQSYCCKASRRLSLEKMPIPLNLDMQLTVYYPQCRINHLADSRPNLSRDLFRDIYI